MFLVGAERQEGVMVATTSVSPSEDLYQRGLAFYRAGNYARSCECADEVLATESNHVSCLVLKGMALVELDETEEATDILQMAVQVAPDNAEAWRQLGIALTMIGERKQAVEALRSSLQHLPDQVPVLVDLGNLLFMMGRVEEAIAALVRARQLCQGDLPILRNLADICASASRPEDALATTLEILDLRPDDILANCDAAWLFLQLGRLDEASAIFRKLRRIDPEQEHELYAVHGLTMTEIKRRNWRKALALAIEATRLDRFDLTTILLSFISAKLFGKTGNEVREQDLIARFGAEHRDHRRLHAEGPG
jgi:tetratricopeptide (TPR) repeat protein